MESTSTPERRRRLVMVSTALLLAGGALVLWAGDWGNSAEPVAAAPTAAPAATPTSRSATPLARTIPIPPTPPDEPAPRPAPEARAEQPARRVFEGPLHPPIRCIDAADGGPLADVRLYQDGAPIAGPSGRDGTLELGAAAGDRLVLWTAGRLPVNVRADALPEEVALEAATGSIELRFVNGSFAHRVRRTLLWPHTPNRGSRMPWTAALEEQGPDLWTATGIAPGTYDVYAWVEYPDEELRSFSAPAVVVDGLQPARRSFDLDAPRNPDDLEADG